MSLDRILNLSLSELRQLKENNYGSAQVVSDSDISHFKKVFGDVKVPRGNKSIEFILYDEDCPLRLPQYAYVYRAFKFRDGWRVRLIDKPADLLNDLRYAIEYSGMMSVMNGGEIRTSFPELIDYKAATGNREISVSIPAMVTYRTVFLPFVSPEEIKEFLEARLRGEMNARKKKK